jgi:hypothetical protein
LVKLTVLLTRGKLIATPAIPKNMVNDKHSSFFCAKVSDEEKKFYNIFTCWESPLAFQKNKIKGMFLTKLKELFMFKNLRTLGQWSISFLL